MPNPDVSGLRTTLGQKGHYWYRFKPVMRWDVVRFLSCGGIILLILGVSGVLSLLPLFLARVCSIHRIGSTGFISRLAGEY
jgi:hypothetical protein